MDHVDVVVQDIAAVQSWEIIKHVRHGFNWEHSSLIRINFMQLVGEWIYSMKAFSPSIMSWLRYCASAM